MIGTNPAGASVAFGRNITVQRIGVGEYRVTAAGPCATTVGAIEVNPEALQYEAGHAPLAYASKESGAFNVWDVHVDDVGGGTVTPIDGQTFDVTVNCQ